MKPNLVIGCGAIAQELVALIKANGLEQRLEVTALPAIWHNTPEKILPGLKEKVEAARQSQRYDTIYIGYADCGTGGLLDRYIEDQGLERIGGDHCYAFYAGQARFAELFEQELGTFYLTDYLARHFDRLIIEGYKLDKHPELLPMMFDHYTKLVYLAQIDDPKLDSLARAAAEKLGGLAYERHMTGYGELADFVQQAAAG
jgi:hypothetical protein